MRKSSVPASERRRNLLLAFLILLAVIVGGVTVSYFALQRWHRLALENAPSVVKLPVPAKPQGTYVGSDKCSECHAEVAARYAGHPKARSLTTIHEASPIEDYDLTLVSAATPQQYYVERRDGDVLHHETVRDTKTGEKVFDLAETVQFAIGSGRRQRNYLLNREGILLQSPVTWRTSEAQWRIVSDYEQGPNFRFERRVGDDCLFCHAGRPATETYKANRYDQPVFHEAAIGCERCHGPGGAHVSKQRQSPTPGKEDDTIVNPTRLTTQQREHVCYQCHLQGLHTVDRYRAKRFDYRPGQLLDEVFVAMTPTVRTDAEFERVDQVQQLRASSCYVQSKGRLGCISCHDPHGQPAAEERVAFYRRQCNTCHQDNGCSLEETQRNQAPAAGSCVHCHMPQLPANDQPHRTFTDHRIRNLGAPPETPDPRNQNTISMVLFDRAETRLPERETQRVRGLAMMTDAVKSQNQELAKQAAEVLLPSHISLERGMEGIGDDVPVLNAFASYLAMVEETHMAEHCWKQVLTYEPKNENTLGWVVRAAFDVGDFQTALPFIDELLEANPTLAAIHARRALVLEQLGRRDEGIVSAERALALNPGLAPLREWLAEALAKEGETERSKQQSKIARQLRAAGVD